jgi:hypothetical protein
MAASTSAAGGLRAWGAAPLPRPLRFPPRAGAAATAAGAAAGAAGATGAACAAGAAAAGAAVAAGGGRKREEPKHDALRFFQQGVADQHLGQGIFEAALLELSLARLGVIGARLAVDQQHAVARPKVAVPHHGPVHSDDVFVDGGPAGNSFVDALQRGPTVLQDLAHQVPQLLLVPLGEDPPEVTVRVDRRER